MTDVTPESVREAKQALGLPPDRVPRSVAIIMDGNGRWARARGLPRTAGHAMGAKTARRIISEAVRLDIRALTLYSFSTENWNRPPEEVETLMGLYSQYLAMERPSMLSNNMRFRHVGMREGLPDSVLGEIDACTEATAGCTGMFLCLALNYGSRAEIARGVRRLAQRVAAGELAPSAIDEQAIADALDTRGVPDPDLLIRTSGEMRVSNFLLWQLSYAEFHVADVYWPDFTEDHFRDALRAFAARDRRFGGLHDASN